MRVQVNISDDMVNKLDMYASKMGVSRSALCSVLIGQAVMGYDKAFEMCDATIKGLKISEMNDVSL